MTTEFSMAVLAEIRKTRDTSILSADEFEELARAILFYGKAGWSIETVARLAAEEVFPVPQRIGRDATTGCLYRMK